MICADFHVFFIAALLLLLLPLDWLAAAIAAALIHELCHILVLYALKGRISGIHIHAGGCVIESAVTGKWREFFCILAGPIGSFSLLLLCRMVPKMAVCGLFQGTYNLIPVLPLDGGRLLRLILYQLCPELAEAILFYTAVGIRVLILTLGIWLSVSGFDDRGVLLVALSGFSQEKYLANRRKSRYNSSNFFLEVIL